MRWLSKLRDAEFLLQIQDLFLHHEASLANMQNTVSQCPEGTLQRPRNGRQFIDSVTTYFSGK